MTVGLSKDRAAGLFLTRSDFEYFFAFVLIRPNLIHFNAMTFLFILCDGYF